MSDQAGEGCAHHGVACRLTGERDSRAGGLQCLILLLGGVLGRFVLLPRRLDLRLALVVLGLRHNPVGQELLDAIELGLRKREIRPRVGDLGHLADIE